MTSAVGARGRARRGLRDPPVGLREEWTEPERAKETSPGRLARVRGAPVLMACVAAEERATAPLSYCVLGSEARAAGSCSAASGEDCGALATGSGTNR